MICTKVTIIRRILALFAENIRRIDDLFADLYSMFHVLPVRNAPSIFPVAQ